jgi:hypothetical protein
MFERLRNRVLRLLRVPPEPEPPFGDPASIRVFRASRKLYWLRLLGWSGGQALAFAGIIFWIGVIMTTERETRKAQAQAARTGRPAVALKPGRNRSPQQSFKEFAARVPLFVFGLLWAAKGVGLLIYAGQLLFTYATVRLDYEMRWYIVTDRSLRIRSGIWAVQEMTMSFANLQQVMLSQGPLQRLLGIADVQVQSAGGGGGAEQGHGPKDSMHTGVFHGVENASEVRDLILNRLRQFRETGLGDPDETHAPTVTPADSVSAAISRQPVTSEAARTLLEEVRRLREALKKCGSRGL